jgi:hypothetical protein
MRTRRSAPKPSNSPDVAIRARTKLLASLLPLWPAEIEDVSIEGRTRLVAVLERALRAERRRGLAGHWTYDLARHMQLLEAYRAEMRAIDAMAAGAKTNRPRKPEVKPEVRSRLNRISK